MKKSTVVSFGKFDANGTGRKVNELTVEIHIKNIVYWIPSEQKSKTRENELNISFMGNVWNSRKTDIQQGGQMQDSIKSEFLKKIHGDNRKKMNKIIEIWEKWHLKHINIETASILEKELNEVGIFLK